MHSMFSSQLDRYVKLYLYLYLGKEKCATVRGLDTCCEIHLIPYLSLLMDIKMKGLLTAQQGIFERIKQCVEILTGEYIS